MSDAKTGIYMLLCIMGSPFIVGVILGWLARGRYALYGLPGAILPGFIRKWLEGMD